MKKNKDISEDKKKPGMFKNHYQKSPDAGHPSSAFKIARNLSAEPVITSNLDTVVRGFLSIFKNFILSS